MPDKQSGFDLDMLTNTELAQIGCSTLGAQREARWHNETIRCHFCGRQVAEPITRYKVGGYDFVPEGKASHKGCAERQVRALIKYLKNEKQTGE